MPTKPLSRRHFLQGAGGIFVALPFLEAMLPALAYAQSTQIKRMVNVWAGMPTSGQYSIPTATGSLASAQLKTAFQSLEQIKHLVSIVSGLDFPTYLSGQAPPAPGSAYQNQHGFTLAPCLAGITSQETMPILVMGQTIDQYAAQMIAGSTRFNSVQARVQALPYNGKTTARNGTMSAKVTNGIVNALDPIASPLQLYNMMFSGTIPTPTPTPNPTQTPSPTATPRPSATPSPSPTPTATPQPTATPSSTPNPTPSQNLLKKKSVLDLVLDDSKRLSANLSGEDKVRLEQHFEEIRNIEKSIMGLPSTTTAMQKLNNTAPLISGGACQFPASPGADPAIGGTSFGSWSEETKRGEIQADLIAYAIACDLTRVASWMLTFDQCWLGSNKISGSTTPANSTGATDVHGDSHFAPGDIVAKNADWASGLFGRLVYNLSVLQDGGVPILNNSYLSLFFSEGPSAHSKKDMRFVIAGSPHKLKIGEHIRGPGHPAQVHIAGMQALGLNFTKLGEVSGALNTILK